MQNLSAIKLGTVSSKASNSKANLAANNQAHLIVFGGTSGIGLALALQHKSLGWQVSVIGHSESKIIQINKDYPEITTYCGDLTDLRQRQGLLEELEQLSFDRVIYSAGSYVNERIGKLDKAQSDLILAINLQVFGQVFAWASQQLKQTEMNQLSFNDQQAKGNRPQVVKPSLICVASIAGILDYPYPSLYAKSKRAMITTASAYRLALAPYNIQVTCIACGYIDTQALRDLNQGDASHKPFIISIEKAVIKIMQAIDDDMELAIFPRPMLYITRVLNKLPKPLLKRLLRRKLDKKSR